jgi:hypothetical protein
MTDDKAPSDKIDRRTAIVAAVITAIIGASATVIAALIGHQQGVSDAHPGPARTVVKHVPWAPCSYQRPGKPMALTAPKGPVVPGPQSNPSGQLGRAHIDSVISPSGSAKVVEQEKVCVTVTKYPTHDRTLWLILRLRLPIGQHPTYQLFFAMGELSDPTPGPYSVNIDRSCTTLPKGSRHTLVIVSAPPSATKQLWENYNARIRSNCSAADDKNRHELPSGTFMVSNQGDVIQG